MDLSTDTGLARQQLRLDQYRGLAREAALAAAGCTLERVRAQREAAAASWTQLADGEEARMQQRRARLELAPLARTPR